MYTVLMHVPSNFNPIIVAQEYQVQSELPSVLEVLTSYVCLDTSQCVFLECSSYASWDACQAKQLASLTLCSCAVVQWLYAEHSNRNSSYVRRVSGHETKPPHGAVTRAFETPFSSPL